MISSWISKKVNWWIDNKIVYGFIKRFLWIADRLMNRLIDVVLKEDCKTL